jgi:KDO2-lipid IV(A) lauroyltransferase
MYIPQEHSYLTGFQKNQVETESAMSTSNAVQAMAIQHATQARDKNLSRFLQSRIVTRFFRLQPSWLNRFYLNQLGRLYFHYASGEREAIQTALKFSLGDRAGQNDPHDHWTGVRRGIIEHYHEKLYQAFTAYERLERNLPKWVDLTGRGELDRALAQGRGVILVTGHYGAVEFIPGTLAVLGYPVTAMVHCKTKDLRIILEEKTARIGIRLLDPKEDSIFFAALKHLKEGRILLTQCDEVDMWRPYKDHEIDFLGFRVGLDRSLDLLARKSRSPVLFGLNHREGRNRYRLHIEPLEPKTAATGVPLVSAQCLSMLESYIYLHPEAWYEWKKFKPFLYQVISETQNENIKRLRVTGQVAVHSPS